MVWGNQESGWVPGLQLSGALDGTLVVRPFRILMVCTGNICRSAMAHHVLEAAILRSLARSFDVKTAGAIARQIEVRSAGTAANEGSLMTRETLRETARFGGDGQLHLARRLSFDDVQSADLILAMSREHRRAVVALDPRASNRVFTLIEFVRLVTAPGILRPIDDSPLDEVATDFPSTLRSMVATISVSRGYLPPPASENEFDIADPYGQSARVYARVGAVIGEAITTLADRFVGAALIT
jgi:protein-tyrosine phosphatase